MEGAKIRVGSRGNCCSAFRTFMTTGCPYTRLPMLWWFFPLPSSSKIKPGCTMNIMSLLLLVFNFQTVGGKCTDNKCSLHARSLPVLSSVSWNSATWIWQKLSMNRISSRFSFPYDINSPGRAALLRPQWLGSKREFWTELLKEPLPLSLSPPLPPPPSQWIIHQWIWLL